jgi:hypothetical protein
VVGRGHWAKTTAETYDDASKNGDDVHDEETWGVGGAGEWKVKNMK